MSRMLLTRPVSRAVFIIAWALSALLFGGLPSRASQPPNPPDPVSAPQSAAPAVLTLQTQPLGLQIRLDSQTYTGGARVQVDPGKVRVLRAVASQARGGKTFAFDRWSNGVGCATNPFVTPANATTYTAFYRVTAAPASTVGVFRPSRSQFLLRNSNTTGVADLTIVFGSPTDLPVVGDWDGDGVDTIGLFRPSSGQFFLRNSNAASAPLAYQFSFGASGDLPLAGDWDGDGRDSIGVFRPGIARFLLRNSLSSGPADVQVTFGASTDRPVVGDWNADGIDTPGIYRPANATFLLTNGMCNCAPPVDYAATFGLSGDIPFTGDWDGDGVTGIGVYRASNGLTDLRNDPRTTGPADVSLFFGADGDLPIAGKWQSGSPPAPLFEPNTGALQIPLRSPGC